MGEPWFGGRFAGPEVPERLQRRPKAQNRPVRTSPTGALLLRDSILAGVWPLWPPLPPASSLIPILREESARSLRPPACVSLHKQPTRALTSGAVPSVSSWGRASRRFLEEGRVGWSIQARERVRRGCADVPSLSLSFICRATLHAHAFTNKHARQRERWFPLSGYPLFLCEHHT